MADRERLSFMEALNLSAPERRIEELRDELLGPLGKHFRARLLGDFLAWAKRFKMLWYRMYRPQPGSWWRKKFRPAPKFDAEPVIKFRRRV